LARGEGPENVAEDFEEECDGNGEKVEGSVAEKLEGVSEKGEEEEEGGKEGEGEGGKGAVDYYGCAEGRLD
jgi:hypothetical protein